MAHRLTVRILVDVDCEHADTEPPRYRLFVDHELFTERTWIWQECYLEEALTVVAAPGQYQIRAELVSPSDACLALTNWRVDHGPGRITSEGLLEIFDANT
jgi:hypothetical protein